MKQEKSGEGFPCRFFKAELPPMRNAELLTPFPNKERRKRWIVCRISGNGGFFDHTPEMHLLLGRFLAAVMRKLLPYFGFLF